MPLTDLNNHNNLKLLLNYFKFIGLSITVVSLFSFIYFRVGNILINNFTKLVFPTTIILGLLLIILSKEKIEDELIYKIRVQTMASCFLLCVSLTIILPYIDYLISVAGADIIKKSVFHINISFPIFWYFINFYVLKITR